MSEEMAKSKRYNTIGNVRDERRDEMRSENDKTKLVTFQMQRNLIPHFNKRVSEDFGEYKKSKVLNALIEGYLTGRYRIAKIF